MYEKVQTAEKKKRLWKAMLVICYDDSCGISMRALVRLGGTE